LIFVLIVEVLKLQSFLISFFKRFLLYFIGKSLSMGSAASITSSTSSSSPIKAKKINVKERRQKSKQLESFVLEDNSVKKPRHSLLELKYRQNGTTNYADEREVTPMSASAISRDYADCSICTYSSQESADVRTPLQQNNVMRASWQSPNPYRFDTSPKSVTRVSSFKVTKDIHSNDECRSNFASALKRIESRHSNRSCHADSFADEYSDYYKRTVKGYASP
jgi:hypothetical protein